MSELKLFVWKDVQCDYTCGVMFALAETVEGAREAIEASKEEWEYTGELYEKEPEVISSPKGFIVHGGG